MGYYAKVEEGIVTKVICAEASYFDTFIDTSPGFWIETDRNTRGGVHLAEGTPLRKNYAGVGSIYHHEADAFSSPQPYPSWTLNETTYIWEPPTPYPETGDHKWDEGTTSWVAL